ncbi:hypothetical protein [Roseateles sp.]|nr:hypothetical protein [Roseateles sp.]
MNKAGAVRWKEFEANVSAATASLRKSIEKSASCPIGTPPDKSWKQMSA